MLGGLVLFLYAIFPTFQSSHFHRIYVAYQGIFIISSIIWGRIVDKKKLNKYKIIRSIVAVIGAAIIFYPPP